MRKPTLAGNLLRLLLSLLLAAGPFLGALVVDPTPAKSLDAAACVELVKDGAVNTVLIAANAAEMGALAVKAAACLSEAGAAPPNPVLAAVIVTLTALAVAGEFSGSSACEAMVNTAIGKMIAQLLQESGLDKQLDKIKSGSSDFIAEYIGGTATGSIMEAIPPLAHYIDCGCSVAGLLGDEAALAQDIKDKINEIAEDAKKCSPVLAKAIEYFDDAVEFFEDGLDVVGNLLDDAYCATLGSVFSDDDCKNNPPTWVDCTNGHILYGASKDVKQVNANTFYSEYENAICQCPSFTTADLSGSYLTCSCPISGQKVQGAACACPAGQSIISFPGHEPFCGVCPAGAQLENGQCISCGPGSIVNTAANKFGVDTKNVCESCGPRSHADASGATCVSCGPNEYKNAATQACVTCDAAKGEYLNREGTACIAASTCGDNEVIKSSVSSGAENGVYWTSYACGCAEGYIRVASNNMPTGEFSPGTCMKSISCSPGQQADYSNDMCINSLDCGDKQVVVGETVYEFSDGTGNSLGAKLSCEACPMDKPNYDKATNTCNADAPQPVYETTIVCGGDTVWSKSAMACRPCPPYAHKSGNTCVMNEYSAQPSLPRPNVGASSGLAGTSVGLVPGATCPDGQAMGTNGACCSPGLLRADGSCPMRATGPDDLQRCPEGYEPSGEYCVAAALPRQDGPAPLLKCPPGLASLGTQCIAPVVWREPDMSACPGGLAVVGGRWCAAALLPDATRQASSCPDGYTPSGNYCVAAVLPDHSRDSGGRTTSACSGVRLANGYCLGNEAITAVAVGAGLGAVLATRRAARASAPSARETPPAKGGLTGTPALVKGTDDKKSADDKKGSLTGTPALVKGAEDEKKSSPSIKGSTVKKGSGDDTIASPKGSKTSTKTAPKAADSKVQNPKVSLPVAPKTTPPRTTPPPPAFKPPPGPTLKLPAQRAPGAGGPLIK